LHLAEVKIAVELDTGRLRPVDVPEMVCDATKFRTRTGWEPHVPFEQSLRDVLDYERTQVQAYA
jgi:GDP-4-dehydro-6-deoxy-D-mannose reductase